MLTWDQLREMQRDGVRVAAHTVSHPFMDELQEEEIVREVEGCFERLRQELGVPPRLLAYPRGRVAEHVKRVLRRVHVEAAVTTESGVNRAGADLMHLRRVDPGMCRSRAGFDPWVFDAELSGCFDLFRR
jgi:peptidoglycan/xylan/chitin deacetylase (PgdA/CDA1 family)